MMIQWFHSPWSKLSVTPMKVKVKATQSYPTLCYPMGYTTHGIVQARILEQVAIPFSMGPSQPRDQTQDSSIAGGFFTSWATREDPIISGEFSRNRPFYSILNTFGLDSYEHYFKKHSEILSQTTLILHLFINYTCLGKNHNFQWNQTPTLASPASKKLRTVGYNYKRSRLGQLLTNVHQLPLGLSRWLCILP